jgi:hypothetical protein
VLESSALPVRRSEAANACMAVRIIGTSRPVVHPSASFDPKSRTNSRHMLDSARRDDRMYRKHGLWDKKNTHRIIGMHMGIAIRKE